jgi:hypothetical protein
MYGLFTGGDRYGYGREVEMDIIMNGEAVVSATIIVLRSVPLVRRECADRKSLCGKLYYHRPALGQE